MAKGIEAPVAPTTEPDAASNSDHLSIRQYKTHPLCGLRGIRIT